MVKTLAILVIILGVVSIAIGGVFVGQGFAKNDLIVTAMQQEQIFQRFYQGERGPRQSSASVGLGLAFCKLAVEAHGGRIFVDANEPRGSVFTVEI